MLETRARDNACFIAFCNAVGGQDELIFDGHSRRDRRRGRGRSRARPGSRRRCSSSTSTRSTRSARRLRDVRRRALARGARRRRSRRSSTSARRRRRNGRASPPLVAARRRARADAARRSSSASRDYVDKNGFRDVVVGVSGGIDSAVTAALAVEALGAGARPLRVDAVALLVGGDARGRAPRWPRASARRSWSCRSARRRRRSTATLAEPFAGREPDLTEENIQARTRGVLLMALSNKFGWLLVATGNKSELSVGYATLYGDMAGGFALLKDVYKTDVFRLARHLNERAGRELIPRVDDRARPERRAAGRPARRGLAAAVCGARPGAGGVRRARPLARRADSATGSTRTSSSARWRWSTGRSTSAGRRRRA